jgi:DNA repair protein SbcC/Rad50
MAATPGLPELPASGDVAALEQAEYDDRDLTIVTTGVAERLVRVGAAGSGIVDAARSGLAVAQGRIEAALLEAGAPTVASLVREMAAAGQHIKDAEAQLSRARQQQPIAAALDKGLRTLQAEQAVLQAIKEITSDKYFPKYVVEQRQNTLLRIASSLLAQLTRDAFGFSEEFMIVDRRTGQPRNPKTLSGGETFLASLALALALVEISNRSGGQLDAFFLDEGFGSLDSSILADALDVLREQATRGRLVGVISHLHAVAAELEDVLVVTKGVAGSDFRWLDAQERDRYLLEDTGAGLLS